jgi:hypothetical protein
MAQQPRQKTIRIDDNWECSLSAAPDRIRKNDELTLTVTLSNPPQLRKNDQPTLTLTLSNRGVASKLTASFKTRARRAQSASSP